MPQKLLDYTIGMKEHIAAFQQHFKIPHEAEAMRQLILDGFKWNGNPLDETARMSVGKGRESNADKALKEAMEHKERYDKIMRDMGYED